MGGHIHLPYVMALHRLARPMWAVQAGTTVSSRMRRPRWSLQNPPLVATQTPPGRIVEIVMQSIAAGRFFCRPLLVNEEPVTA
mgnify:CR=1 FL=1